jgi:hypothetical protein
MVGVWKAAQKVDPTYGYGFLRYVRNKVRWECADLLRSAIRRGRNLAPLGDRPHHRAPADAAALVDYLPAGDPRLPLVEGYYLEGLTLKELARRHKIRPQVLAPSSPP